MSEPDQYEMYRVILDYEALQDGFLDRIEDLNTTLEQIDMNGGFAKGNAQKLLGKGKGRLRRGFGWESLGKMLKGTGLALVLVLDDERFASMKDQLAQRKRPRHAGHRQHRPTPWLFTSKKAREIRALQISKLSPQQRKKIAKIAAGARWRAPRKVMTKVQVDA